MKAEQEQQALQQKESRKQEKPRSITRHIEKETACLQLLQSGAGFLNSRAAQSAQMRRVLAKVGNAGALRLARTAEGEAPTQEKIPAFLQGDGDGTAVTFSEQAVTEEYLPLNS